MGFADVWNRTLVYFGIAEEDDWDDDDGYATNEELERSYGARERANVRRLQPRRGRDFDDESSQVAETTRRPVARIAAAPVTTAPDLPAPPRYVERPAPMSESLKDGKLS